MSDFPILDKMEQRSLHDLSDRELTALAEELRRFLIEHVSQTGGHLASNLGIVEISLALQLCFDWTSDRIVYDVGHQCYIHKILNGRKDAFNTLRTYGGISGYPRPDESCCDAFHAGHSSTAVSAALGIARALKLQGKHDHVVAVLGDGALTGGLAYEALNDAGSSGQPLIVILNDNGMSITKNVGAVAGYLTKLRMRGTYLRLKKGYHKVFDHLRFLSPLDRFLRRVKNAFKHTVIPATIFEDMGFAYYGPYNGHDLSNLRYQFEAAKKMNRPVLLHLKTVKGRGYMPAEQTPNDYHGVGPFDPRAGVGAVLGKVDYSLIAGNFLCELAREDERICAITAAMPYGTGLNGFSAEFPKRFFDVGIAEGHAVTMAAGMATRGIVPVFAVYSTFLQRSYDQLIHDAAISRSHMVLLIDRAGLVGEDGETHNGVFDVGFLSQIPGVTVYSPSCAGHLKECIFRAVYRHDGIVAVRYPKVSVAETSGRSYRDTDRLTEGDDLTVVTYGRVAKNALEAVERLGERGISADLFKLNKILPVDLEPITASVAKSRRLIVVEEVNRSGCIGEHIAAALSESGCAFELDLINLGDRFIPHGSVDILFEQYGLSGPCIFQRLNDFAAQRHEV